MPINRRVRERVECPHCHTIYERWESRSKPGRCPDCQKTKANYEKYMNDLGESFPEEYFIIGGQMRRMKYGTALRKHDPIAFEVGYREWTP